MTIRERLWCQDWNLEFGQDLSVGCQNTNFSHGNKYANIISFDNVF